MNFCAISGETARAAARCSAPVSSEVSPKQPYSPSGTSLSYMLPTVGQEASPVVVSLSPHLAATHRSVSAHSSRTFSEARMHELLGLARGGGDGRDVAVALDREARHRLAGLGDAVDDTVWVQPGSMPMTMQAATLGLAPVPIMVRKCSSRSCAELQPAVGVRQGDGALDVGGDRLAGGVGDIVERQDGDVVAHADPAVLAPVAPDCAVRRFHGLPALGLEVVGMDVIALADAARRLVRCPGRT